MSEYFSTLQFILGNQDEIMLAACRNDQDDVLEDLLMTKGDQLDVNFTDSIGDTALHYA